MRTRLAHGWIGALSTVALLAACGDDDASPPDGGPPDTGPVTPATTEHCEYAPAFPTARAGGTVTAAAFAAGAAEALLDLPVGSALGAYGARAGFLGDSDPVDARFSEMSESFNPSVGIETIPKVRAVALRAGDETAVIVKLDVGVPDEGLTWAITEALGPELSGKVIVTASHTHSGFAQYPSASAMQLAFGRFRDLSWERVVATSVAVARAAIDAIEPARIGIVHDGDFDPEDLVTGDRREENDDLPGGSTKDRHLFVMRIDAVDGRPIAIVPVFGVHGTVLGAENPYASTDAPGAVERAIEESFDSPVVVMHLQGAAGDVTPKGGQGGIACSGAPCFDFARLEAVGRHAAATILARWNDAAATLAGEVAIEMLTRPIALGPDWETFRIRDGALEYAPFDPRRTADRVVFAGDGALLSPIDEFSAPYGAALCGEDHDSFLPRAQMRGTAGLRPYRSCMRVDETVPLFSDTLALPFEETPLCSSTRTAVAAMRIGDFLLVGVPGEPLTVYAEALRDALAWDRDRTIVLGYAQDYVGYLLTPEDWLRGGYEPAINFWGPLEGEYVLERAVELAELATTEAREDAAAGAATRWVPPEVSDDLPPPDPAGTRGTVPATIPPALFARGATVASAQPAPAVPRLDVARFVWIGEDPIESTPRVVLERESATAGTFEPVLRRSTREVQDGDLLLTYTPDPLVREGDAPRTHHWLVEWQVTAPWGTEEGDDALAARAGVPLGRYRFRVTGAGYEVASEAFEVVPAAIAVTATREGDAIRIGATLHAPNGWRLLRIAGPSNAPYPVPGTLTLTAELDDGTTTTATATLGEGGTLLETFGVPPTRVVRVTVADAWGNVGTSRL